MARLDWILVVFGAAVALAGGWIQLYPERVIPGYGGPGYGGPGYGGPGYGGPGYGGPDGNPDWQLDPGARAQIRLLGACFLAMGTFFALQMTIDLARCPWWIGTLSGLAAAIAAVIFVSRLVRRQRRGCRAVPPAPLAEKALELQ